MNEEYINFCKSTKIPFYGEPYWLDLASSAPNKGWESIVIEQDGEVQLAMAYHYVRKYGFKILIQAQLTSHTFLYLSDQAKADTTLRNSLFAQLSAKLKNNGIDFAIFRSEKDFQYTNELKKHGYGIKKLRTYVVKDHNDRDELLKMFHQMKRRAVKKALKNLNLKINDCTPEQYYDFYGECLKSKGKTIDFKKNWFLPLFCEAYKRGNITFFSIYSQNELHSILCCVHDHEYAYAVTYAISEAGSRSGASAMMMFEAIDFFRNRGLHFDFEGGNFPNYANSYSKFATQETPVYSIFRSFTLKGWLLKNIFLFAEAFSFWDKKKKLEEPRSPTSPAPRSGAI